MMKLSGPTHSSLRYATGSSSLWSC